MIHPVDQNRIWLYWENRPGSEMPAYIDLAIQTVKAHAGSYEMTLLNEKTIGDYIQLPNHFRRIKQLAHKADYIRAQLLHLYGGIWLDSDIIVLRNLETAVQPYIKDYDFVGYGREYGKPSIGFMACRRQCRLMQLWAERVERVVNQRNSMGQRRSNFRWTEMSFDILWPIASGYAYQHHEREMFAPVFWSDWQLFASADVQLDQVIGHNPFAVMLYNQCMFDVYEKVAARDILKGDTLLSKLFRLALHI
jgi:Capsular polysaccharide synthesis protein